jgi:membrane peptidoglycan carboxypeptidase
MSLVVGVFTAGWIGWAVPQARGEIGSESTTVYYANGQVMGKFAAVDRTIRGLDELPPHVPAAVVASEDQNFENHMGVDPAGIVRAFVSNVTGGTRQGASTLTQQYVENTYFEPGQSSYADKFREIILALKVDREKSKDEILEGYVNSIYLGRGAYGFEAAAKAYFNKPAAELTVSETAMLVGIIPSPSYWDPRFGEESRAVAEEKWARVLRNMVQTGAITEQERASATFPEPVEYKPVSRAGQVGYLLEEVRKELAEKDGLGEEDLMKNGYEIQTTINPKWQKAAVETAATIPYKGEGAASKRLGVSIVSVDPKDGAIRALYGGRDYETQQFNAATDGKAQPGSTFKPFTLIGALEDGHELNEYYTGNSPMQIPGWRAVNPETGVEEEKELTNFGPAGSGGESFGDIDLVDATAHSVNTVYAQLNVEITPKKSQDVAIRAGIPKESTNAELSNVLGTEPVRAVDLAGAYATFAAQGTRTEPHMVTSVKDGDEVVYKWDGAPQVGVIDPVVMAKATYALQQVVNEGSGTPAKELLGPDGKQRPVAGKTGSTNNNMAAWFAGYIPQLSTVVGLYQTTEDGGQAPITPFGEWAGGSLTGGTWPVTAWTHYMQAVTEGMEVKEFPPYVEPVAPTPTPTPTPTPSETPDDKVLVPTGLVGQPIAGVMAVLAATGLNPVLVEVENEQQQGLVLSVQHEGQEVNRGTDIRVEVSTGPAEEETTQVPGGLIGNDEGNARGQLQAAGLQPSFEYRESRDFPEGAVMEVSPGEGTEVPAGSPVRVIVSTGPPDIGFPTAEPTDGGGPGDGDGDGNGNGNGNGNGGP